MKDKEIEYWKGKYENMRADFEMSDDAAEYWQEEFVEFYNRVHRIVVGHFDEVVDVTSLVKALDEYGGQSDKQYKI